MKTVFYFDGTNRKLSTRGKVKLLDKSITQKGLYVETGLKELDRVIITYARKATFADMCEVTPTYRMESDWDGTYLTVSSDGLFEKFIPESNVLEVKYCNQMNEWYVQRKIVAKLPNGSKCHTILVPFTVDYGMESGKLLEYFYVDNVNIGSRTLNISNIIKLFGMQVAEKFSTFSENYKSEFDEYNYHKNRREQVKSEIEFSSNLLKRLKMCVNDENIELAWFALQNATSFKSLLEIIRKGFDDGEHILSNGKTLKISSTMVWDREDKDEYTIYYRKIQ
jgi:hypothetical protein